MVTKICSIYAAWLLVSASPVLKPEFSNKSHVWKSFSKAQKGTQGHLSLIWAKLGWLSLFALIWKEMEEYFTSVTAELEIKYYKQSRDVGNLEFIWSTYSVWPDQLQHLNNRREENGVFNKVQVLQVQCREFENHVVQQIWKTGSPNSGNCIAWFVLNPLWYESLPLDFTVFPGWKTPKCMLSLISKGSDA